MYPWSLVELEKVKKLTCIFLNYQTVRTSWDLAQGKKWLILRPVSLYLSLINPYLTLLISKPFWDFKIWIFVFFIIYFIIIHDWKINIFILYYNFQYILNWDFWNGGNQGTNAKKSYFRGVRIFCTAVYWSYSGHRKLFCEFSKLSKLNAIFLLGY